MVVASCHCISTLFFLRDPNTKSIHFRNNLFLHRVSSLVYVYRDQIWTLILHPPHHFNTADTNSWTNLKNSISGADIRAVCDRDRPRTLGVPLILGLGWRWAELGEGDVGAPRFKYLWSSIRKQFYRDKQSLLAPCYPRLHNYLLYCYQKFNVSTSYQMYMLTYQNVRFFAFFCH